MRGGVIFLVVALLLAYIAVSGRYKCFAMFFACLFGPDASPIGPGTASATAPPEPLTPATPAEPITSDALRRLEAVEGASEGTLPQYTFPVLTPEQRRRLEAVEGRPE